MPSKTTIITFFSCLCWPLILFGQHKRLFDHNEGLSNSLINQVYQDHKGFIWVATEDGLNRFDGIQFTSFVHDHQPNALRSNFVTAITEDKSGDLWIGQISGVQRYDYASETFHDIDIVYQGQPIHPFVSDVFCAGNGDIWIATSGYGIFLVKKGTEKPQHLSAVSGNLSSYFIRTLYEDSEGIIWIGSDNKGLHSYDPTNREVRNYLQSASHQYELLGSDISSICEDDKGGIFVGSLTNGLVRLDKHTGIVERINSADPAEENLPVKSLLFDSKKRLWVGTDGFGLKQYNPSTHLLVNQIPSSSLFDFSKSKVHSVLEDSEGNVWTGIFQKGLFLFPEEPEMFEHFGYEAFGTNSIGSSSITSISGRGDSLWIGTDGDGIYLLNQKNAQVRHIVLRNAEGGVKGKNILVLHDQKGPFLWIGTYSNGLIRYNKNDGTLKTFKNDPDNPNSLINDKIAAITEDRNGHLILGTLGDGICTFDIAAERFEQGLPGIDTLNSRIQKWVNDICLDRNGDYWIGTYGGLFHWSSAHKTLHQYAEADKTLPNNTVYCIQQSEDGTIWAGTYGGLVSFQPHTFESTIFRMEDGLSSNVICAIEESKHHQLWISTHNGLSQLDPEKGTFTNYFVSDGIQSNEFSRKASFKTKEKTLFFGGINGITKIKRDFRAKPAAIRKVLLTDFTLFNTPVKIGDKSGKHRILNKSIVVADTIQLREHDNVFSISFTSPELARQSRMTYEYKMKGFDAGWNTTDAFNRRATYTNLPYGHYHFLVRAVDKDKHSEARQLAILIFPPWYKTIWAKILWGLLAFGLVYGIFLYNRERFLHKQAERVNEMKMQFFINISHEIKTPLTLILDPLEKLLTKHADRKTLRLYRVMYQNANRIFRLVNQLMDVRKIDKGLLLVKYQKTNIYQFIQEITHSYDLLVDSKDVTLDIETTNPNIEVWIDPLNFEKVVQNLLSNAFKHTPEGGNIKIIISEDTIKPAVTPSHVRITVRDSGTGIPSKELERVFNRFYQVPGDTSSAEGGTGIGLHLSRSLVELHKGTLIAENRKDASGTDFMITLPLGHMHLSKEDLLVEENILPAHHRLSPEALAIHEPHSTANASAATNYKVMVVDDEQEVRDYLVEELSDRYHVTGYADGKRAFEHLLEEKPDLIVSDIMMPGMDGITFCKKVKGNMHTSHIPVVLLTALSKEENRAEGIETGADMYLVKPFNSDFLKKTIAGILENRMRIYEKFNNDRHPEEMENVKLRSHDEILMQKVMTVIRTHISDRALNVEMLAENVGISRVHMHRKLKAITNQSARDLIRSVRMKQAAYLLTTTKVNVSEVAYAVGYSNLSHFSHSFKSHYGVSPKEYVESQCVVE